MNHTEERIVSGCFTYNGREYDCNYLIERDKQVILREADDSHKEAFDKLYIRESLEADRCRIYADENDNIIYLMIIYTIKYRDCNSKRTACGDYYPFYVGDGGKLLPPHPYQGMICW